MTNINLEKSLLILVFSLISLVVQAKSLEYIKAKIHSASDVVDWSANNLYYKNVDSWDKAPPLQKVLDDGYGDCKMLAGVVSELLNHIDVKNWIVTIKREKNGMYHMFNVYFESSRGFRVINNARLVETTFKSWTEILEHFGSSGSEFIKKHRSYNRFRKWFNQLKLSEDIK